MLTTELCERRFDSFRSFNRTVYGYNSDKDPISFDLADGRRSLFSYDSQGRLTSKGVWYEGLYLYEYDTYDHTKVTAITRTNGVRLEKEYFGPYLKAESQISEAGGAPLARVEFGYDDNLRPSKVVLNDNVGTLVHVPFMEYDKDELLTQAGAISISRDDNGMIKEKKMGRARVLYEHDATYGELNKIEYRYDNRTQFVQKMSRDKLGRISEMDSTTGRLVLHYDHSGRFIGRTPKGHTSPYSKFVYDANGNRISGFEGDKTFTAKYDAQDRLIWYNSLRYTYNPTGNLASRSEDGVVTSYSYDVFGNLLKISQPNSEIEYLIDGHDRRVAKKVNGTVTKRYIWQDQLRIAAELTPSGKIRQQYVYSDGVNSPDYMVFQNKLYFFVKDHRGSINLVVDVETGNITQRMQYSEFGEVTEDTNPGFQPFGFAGGLYDPETKLVRFGARDYDGRIGRWLSKDPIRFDGGDTNLYGYVLQDPVNSFDPAGLQEMDGSGGISGDYADALRQIEVDFEKMKIQQEILERKLYLQELEKQKKYNEDANRATCIQNAQEVQRYFGF